MEATAPVVEPADPNAMPAQAAAPATEESAGQLPDELLQVPAMQALIAGSPPAVSANIQEFASNPAAQLIAANKPAIMKAGIGFYHSLGGDLGVLFNMFHVHPEDLQAADKAGKLTQLAPPFDSVNMAVGKSGANNPVLSAQSLPGGFKPASMKAPPQMAAGMPGPAPAGAPAPSVTPAAAGLQSQIMKQRAVTMNPGPPTSGPKPGAGRLLNQILKPTV